MLGRCEEPRGERVERLGRDFVEHEPALLGPARELAAGAVELAVGRQNAQLLRIVARTGCRQPEQEVVRVRGKYDRIRAAGAELGGDIGLRLGPDLVHHPVPFVVGQPRGVVPRLGLSVEAGVGPEMVAVRGEMEPLGVGLDAPREQILEAQRSVLSAHNSGKIRLSSVERRYAAPAEPPVPRLLPMIRSTVSTCLCRHIASASSRSTSFSASW